MELCFLRTIRARLGQLRPAFLGEAEDLLCMLLSTQDVQEAAAVTISFPG